MAKKRSLNVTLVPSSTLRVNVRYLREAQRRILFISWPSQQRRKPKFEALTRSEQTRLYGLLQKFCESAYK